MRGSEQMLSQKLMPLTSNERTGGTGTLNRKLRKLEKSHGAKGMAIVVPLQDHFYEHGGQVGYEPFAQ